MICTKMTWMMTVMTLSSLLHTLNRLAPRTHNPILCLCKSISKDSSKTIMTSNCTSKINITHWACSINLSITIILISTTSVRMLWITNISSRRDIQKRIFRFINHLIKSSSKSNMIYIIHLNLTRTNVSIILLITS